MSKQSRQSFLGCDSESVLATTTAGIVGLSGGGSHTGQQLAHVGVGGFVLIDPQAIEETNLNRLVGATAADVFAKTPKTAIAQRLILGIRPSARITAHQTQWQLTGETLRECDAIFGCVDSYKDRNELERAARRYLIPYIDIGMSVRQRGTTFDVSGQIVLSLPGGPCMWCLGILREDLLAEEAADYGAAGVRQQVIWPNGVLASTAVGLFMQLMTPWAGDESAPPELLEYDGNRNTVVVSNKLSFVRKECPHFAGDHDLGDPFWKTN